MICIKFDLNRNAGFGEEDLKKKKMQCIFIFFDDLKIFSVFLSPLDKLKVFIVFLSPLNDLKMRRSRVAVDVAHKRTLIAKAISSKHRSKFAALSPVVVTAAI
jgi:hypothetical protein